MAKDDNPFFDLANIDLSAGPPRDAMYSGFVPGTNPMARKAEQQRLMRESKQLTPAAALMRGLGEGYFGDITTPNAEQGYSVMDASSRAPAGREADMQRYRDVGTALGIVADPATMLAPLAKPATKALGRGALSAAQSDKAYDLANKLMSATGAGPMHVAPPDLARRIFNAPVSKLGRAGVTSTSGKILTETFTPEELELIKDSVVMSRRKTLDDLAGADKRLKSVHETNRTGAASGPLKSKQFRSEREPHMFGDIGQTYGYLTLDPLATLSGEFSPRFPNKGISHIAPTSQIPEYGRFGLLLHPELRGRTTFTIDDSLDRTLGSRAYPKEILRSMPYENSVEPGSILHDLLTDYDSISNRIVENLKAQGTPQWQIPERLAEELVKINKPATFAELLKSEGLPPMDDFSGSLRIARQIPRILDNPTEPSLLSSEIYQLGGEDSTHFRNKLLQRDPMGYVEAQVHGDVTPEHIQRIYDFGYEPSLKAEKQAKQLGIEYVPRPHAAYDIIKRENPQTMGEFYRLAEELGVLPSYLRGRQSDDAMLPFGGNYAKGGKVSTNPFDHLV